jgi:hypothetical protein
MTQFNHHLYKWSKPFSAVRHHWELVGPDGGIHLHISLTPEYPPSCGLEFHHTREAWKRRYGREEPCHHKNCPVLGEPCWHDGTSMWASELWENEVRHALKAGAHEEVFRLLEREYGRHFGVKQTEDA